MEEKKDSLETRFEHMEALLERMESKDLTLEEAFSLYKTGLADVKVCNDMLDQVEKEMLVLNSDGELEEF